MTTIAEELASAAAALKPVTETPRLDAELLLAHALGLRRAQLLARLKQACSTSVFHKYLQRRLAQEPIAYIVGEWEFFSLPFYMEPPILVPRPETEHLVEVVLEHQPRLVLDACAGSGCVAVAVAKNLPGCRVIATDTNPQAVALARRNAARHGVGDRVDVREGDLLAPAIPDAPFDVVCANPPYVETGAWDTLSPNITRYEDPRALLAGSDGLDVIRRLVAEAPAVLKPGGWLALELGMGQYDAVATVMQDQGYTEVMSRNDLASIPRIVAGRART
jgi:release factor glutamine methyltransferase